MRERTDLTPAILLAGLVIAASAAGLLIAASAAAQTGSSPTISSPGTSGSSQLKATDKTFVRKAAEGGLAEVELGKLAAAKGTDPEVKSFGQKMVDDHSKANDKLKQTVGAKGVDLPSDMSAKDKALQARLDKMSGAAFDRAYMKEMLKDHQKDVAEFRRESKRAAADPDVKSFASETLPTLEEHLKMAQDVSKKVGVTSGGPSRSHSSRSSHPDRAAGTNPGH